MNTDQKIDHIYKSINEQNITLAKFIAYQEQHRKELDVLNPKVDKIVSTKDRIIGIAVGISFVVSGAISVVVILLKH